jgi:uncharacterized ferritin-like protein (DUF455 family)
MEFFTTLEDILQTADPHKKIEKFNSFYPKFKSMEFDHDKSSIIFKEPSFASVCKIVPATKVPRRRSLKSKEDRAILLHAIAHIEYSAIDLALDHAYRFKNMPMEYYHDWLEVADDEVRHFLMLEKMLKELGYSYGDFAVHSFLFDTSMATAKSLVDRMAVIPRYLEASGLDANPKLMERVKKLDDEFSKEFIKALDVILTEEITHVKKGDKWFKFACEKSGTETSLFYDIVEKYLPGATRKKEFVNVEFRKKAGYSCEEIEGLAKEKICKENR